VDDQPLGVAADDDALEKCGGTGRVVDRLAAGTMQPRASVQEFPMRAMRAR